MNLDVVYKVFLLVILISIQYTLNKILYEMRLMKKDRISPTKKSNKE